MKTMFAKFGGTCARCGHRFPAGTVIEWSRERGAVHEDLGACVAAQAAPAPLAPPTIDLKPIADFLIAARDRGGLKFPKARFLGPGGRELRLALAGPTAKVPGSIQVNLDDEWMGRVEPSGRVAGQLQHDTALIDLLLTIAGNPAEAAKAYGALMCRCSFCHLPLADAGSVEVGYGPVCAKKWGLPHAPRGIPTLTMEVAS